MQLKALFLVPEDILRIKVKVIQGGWTFGTCWRRPEDWRPSWCASPLQTPAPRWRNRPGGPSEQWELNVLYRDFIWLGYIWFWFQKVKQLYNAFFEGRMSGQEVAFIIIDDKWSTSKMRMGVQQRMKMVTTITSIGTIAFMWAADLSELKRKQDCKKYRFIFGTWNWMRAFINFNFSVTDQSQT